MLPTDLTIVTSQDMPAIDRYVKTHIYDLYQSKYEDFVPLIATKIEALCKQIFAYSQNNPTRFSVEEKLNLDTEGADLIITCMARKYGFDFRTAAAKTFEAEHNAFDSKVLRDEKPLRLTCWWTPKNPHIFPKQLKCRYQPNPAGCSTSLLIFAKKAVETDLILVSAQKEEIHAHALLLKLNSEYFKIALTSSFKESKNNVIELPYSTTNINNLVQFLYVGTIDSENSDLLELLGMAHLFQIKDLFNFCIDLLSEHLNKKSVLSHKEIEDLIISADLYEIEDFFKPCLEFAERLEALESTSTSSSDEEDQMVVDWHRIPHKLHIFLLGMAVENRLNKVVQSLKEVVNRQYVIEESTKGKDKN